MDEAILTPTKLSDCSEGRVWFMPFELKGSLYGGWLGLVHSTGWHRADTQKPTGRILALTKSAQWSWGSFPDFNYKHMAFPSHSIYFLVLQALMKAYYVPSSMLDTRHINTSGLYSQNPLVQWKRQTSSLFQFNVIHPITEICSRLYGSSIANKHRGFQSWNMFYTGGGM